MNNVLDRASRVIDTDSSIGGPERRANDIEDETDLKMRQLLEDIYSIQMNTTTSNYTDLNENESKEGGAERFDERFGEESSEPYNGYELDDARKFEELKEQWSYGETKGIF